MKQKLLTITILIGVVVLIILFVFQCVFLLPIMYKNNHVFLSTDNKQIKELVLMAIKDRCSCLYEINKDDIYSSQSEPDIVELIEPSTEKSMFCFIDRNFMDTLVKTGPNTYTVIVKCYFPESYIYHLTMEKQSGKYVITEFLLDI
jgi:hypothetical protein